MSISETITCPHCKKSFELSDALSHDFESKVHEQVQAELKKKEATYKQKLDDAEKEKLDLAKKSEAEKKELKTKIEKELSAKLQEKFELENQDLKNRLEEQSQRAKTAQTRELEILKQKRELEQRQTDMELEVARKLDAERKAIQLEVQTQIDQANSLKIAEKDKELNDLKKKIDELKRKSEVSSQQLQGEVLELQIEELLSELFPDDEIVEVKKGTRGADITQKISFQSGRKVGQILYECKQTSDWGTQWTSKLKEDMRESSSDVGIIVSSVLPKEIKSMGFHDGVWICTTAMLKPLAQLIREGLVKAARAELAAATPQDHKDMLFKYMTSPKFTQKIQAMCETTISMKETLESEKRSLQKNWKKREQEIEGIENQMINLYGELEGVVGVALPKVEALQISAPE